MATGDADKWVAGMKAHDPDNHGTIDDMGADHVDVFAFFRGFRNCVQGNSYDTNWSVPRRDGYKAAQALGLFGVGP